MKRKWLTFCPDIQIHLLPGSFDTDLGQDHVKTYTCSHCSNPEYWSGQNLCSSELRNSNNNIKNLGEILYGVSWLKISIR